MKNQLIAIASIFFATPAAADEFYAVTPSGSAEVLFPTNPTAVVGKLSSKCIDARWTVTSSNDNELVCESPLNMGQSVMGQLLLGNSYSTPPRRFFRFNVAEINGISRVQASGWMELQMAFGQVKRTDFSGPEFHNSIMNFMGAAGGKLPTGTTFPNHAFLGVQNSDVSLGKNTGAKVVSLAPGLPAEKAGIQAGDVISKIAGKQFKNQPDFFDALAKAAQTPTYEVEVMRDGKPKKITVERAYRPAITEVIIAQAEILTPPPPASSSVADELEKLAKLREAGVLTDAEFQAQKVKVLGQ